MVASTTVHIPEVSVVHVVANGTLNITSHNASGHSYNASVAIESVPNHQMIFGVDSFSEMPAVFHTCIDSLKFTDFQAKMQAKLAAAQAARGDSDGGKSGSLPPGQDSVFRLLMQKIKSLEMKNAIVDLYMAQVSDCYRQILTEAVAENMRERERIVKERNSWKIPGLNTLRSIWDPTVATFLSFLLSLGCCGRFLCQ